MLKIKRFVVKSIGNDNFIREILSGRSHGPRNAFGTGSGKNGLYCTD